MRNNKDAFLMFMRQPRKSLSAESTHCQEDSKFYDKIKLYPPVTNEKANIKREWNAVRGVELAKYNYSR